MEDKHFFVFLLSLLVLPVEVVDCGHVMAHSAPQSEVVGVDIQAVETEDEDARGDLPVRNSTWAISDADSLEEIYDFINSLATPSDGGNTNNGRMVEPEINGTTTEPTTDHEELEKAIHEMNMKLLLSVFIFLSAVAATALLVIVARKWCRMRTMFPGRVPPATVDAENMHVRFCNLHLDNYL